MKISYNLIQAGWHLKERDVILDFVLASVVLAMYDLTLIKKRHTLNYYSFLQ